MSDVTFVICCHYPVACLLRISRNSPTRRFVAEALTSTTLLRQGRSKTEFESRPVYVWTNAHIEGHFATCFTALVLIRLLQTKLGSKYPVGKTIQSLRKYNCTQIDNTLYQFIYYDEIIEECGKKFGMELNNRYRTREQIRRMLKY